MTKKDLATSVAKQTGLSIGKALEVINISLKEIKSTVSSGDSVNFTGFGGFKPTVRKARVGFSPKTRETIHIPEKTVVKFVASKDFFQE